MHRERAACFMYAKQYADVVVEATRALKTTPNDPTALFYRAKAYELLGQGKKAKADAAAAANADASDDQAKKAIDAAKAMLAPADAKPAGGPAGLGGLGLAPGKKASDAKNAAKETPLTAAQIAERKAAQARQAEALRQRANQQKWGPPVAVKATCGADARVVIVPSMISHKDLMTTLQRKFPDTSAFSVRFTDADGASKPLNSRADFAAAFVAAQAAKAKGGGGGRGGGAHAAQPAGPQARHRRARRALPRRARRATKKPPPATVLRLSRPTKWSKSTSGSWISPALFREHLGIDAEAHLDLHAEVRRGGIRSIPTLPTRKPPVDFSLDVFLGRFRATPWRR
jgi:tetratricopeptide (TPR) repeat protein